MGTELFLVPFFIFWQDHLSSKPLWAFLIFESIFHVYFELLIYRLGAHYRSSNVGTEQDIPVEKIISHHSYRKPYGMAHDIAMVKLSRPATLNKAVNIACLPSSGGDVADGKMCWVTGRRNEKLKWSKLPKHSMSLQLNWIYMEVRRNWVHNGTFILTEKPEPDFNCASVKYKVQWLKQWNFNYEENVLFKESSWSCITLEE